MFYLLPHVMGIALTGIILVTTMNFTSFGAKHALDLETSVIDMHETFQRAFRNYKRENISYVWVEDCPPNASSGDPECLFDREIDPLNDGSIDVANWETQLISDYMHDPYVKEVVSWDVGEDGSGIYVCSQLKYGDIIAKTSVGLLRNYGSDSFKVGSTCAVATSLTESEVLSYAGENIYLTKWINY